MTLDAWLRDRSGWLLMPLVLTNAPLAIVILPWLMLLSRDVAQRHLLLQLVAVAIGLAGQLAVWSWAGARLPVFRGLAAGRLTATPAVRLQALVELRRLPMLLSLASGLSWFITPLAVSLTLVVLADADMMFVARMFSVSVLVSPLSATVVALLTSTRTNEAGDRLADGLPPHDVVATAPGVEWGVQGRMVIFTVLLTAVPVLIASDIARRSIERAADVLSGVAPGLRRAAADALLTELAVRLGLFGVMAVLFAVFAAWVGGRSLAHPLRQLAGQAGLLARGELGTPRVVSADGEVWRVTGVFALLHERLAGLVGRIVDAGHDITSASASLAATSRRSEATATEQAAALNETSATTEELARSARQIAASAGSVLELAQRTLEAANQGTDDAAAFQAAVDRMKQDNRSIASAVDRLQRRVQQIGRIVELINTVADRSDLLALSAELEGTRAGEVGRGFSLVGAEMRRLAENVLESTAEVEELIAEIRDATVRTAEATERGGVLTDRGTSLADDVTAALLRVAELAEETSSQVRTITLATQQQKSGTDQLAEAMAEILAGTQEDLAVTHRLTEVNQQLLGLSSSLQEAVSRFSGSRGEG
ncbi:MAG: methyl-accepting chemotaxis protein [Archangium sp.]